LLGKYFLEAAAPSSATQTTQPAAALVPVLD
jgi:hypothetical protein